MPIFDPDGKCPLLNKKCIKHQCVWYNMLQGKNPQSGANTGKQIQTSSAVESFRNEMVKANMVTLALVDQKNKQDEQKQNPAGSFWSKIANGQEAIANGEELEEDMQLLQNKKNVKKKKETKKVVKKNGNNNKHRNNK